VLHVYAHAVFASKSHVALYATCSRLRSFILLNSAPAEKNNDPLNGGPASGYCYTLSRAQVHRATRHLHNGFIFQATQFCVSIFALCRRFFLSVFEQQCQRYNKRTHARN
jgi:hypothetical protein